MLKELNLYYGYAGFLHFVNFYEIHIYTEISDRTYQFDRLSIYRIF